MKVVSEMNLSSVPHIPQRRTSPERASMEIDDIITVFSFLDTNMKLNDLPRFVTDKTAYVPSKRLFEGDLHYLAGNMRRLEDKVEMVMDAVSRMYEMFTTSRTSMSGQRSSQRAGELAQTETIWPKLPGSATTSTTAGVSTVNVMNERSTTKSRDPPVTATTTQSAVGLKSNHSFLWSTDVEQSAVETDENIDNDNNGFMLPSYQEKCDRRRTRTLLRSSVGVDQNVSKKRVLDDQHGNVSSVSPHGQAVTDSESNTNKQTRKPLAVGKRVAQFQGISSNAGNVVVPNRAPLLGRKRKRVFYLDNVDPSYNENDVKHFLQLESITVVSCLPVQPRKRWQGQDTSDRAAFRLCIYDDKVDVLLNPYILPRGVTVHPWVFKPRQVTRDTAEILAGNLTQSQAQSARPINDRPTISHSASVDNVDDSVTVEHVASPALQEHVDSFHLAMDVPLEGDSISPTMESTVIYDPVSTNHDGDI